MYVELVVGNLDTVFVEGSLDRLENIEIDRPVVTALHPYAGNDVDAARTVARNSDRRCGILENELVRVADLGDNSLSPLEIVAVADGEGEINSSRILDRIVNDSAAR